MAVPAPVTSGPTAPEQFPQAPKALNRGAADMPSANAAATSAGPTEIVVRPKGLRHGRWEAPEWAFWTIGATVLVLAAIYVLVRLGYVGKKRSG